MSSGPKPITKSKTSAAATTTMSSGPSPPPHVVEDYRGVVRVFSDGSIVRSGFVDPRCSVPVRDDGTIEWKDVQFDAAHGLHLRLYKPRHRLPSDEPKLPIFYYFHGGGFCIGSCTWPNYHNCCLRLAAELRALVNRHRPRLPPRPRAPPPGCHRRRRLRRGVAPPPGRLVRPGPLARRGGRLRLGVHLRRVVRGEHRPPPGRPVQLGLRPGRVRPGQDRWVRSDGAVLWWDPAHEIRGGVPEGGVLELETNDSYWRLSLPPGATRDHPVANPFGPESPNVEAVEVEPMLVVVAERDLMRDRGVEYARMLEGSGKRVELVEIKGQLHEFFSLDAWAEPVDELMRVIKRFMDEVKTGSG